MQCVIYNNYIQILIHQGVIMKFRLGSEYLKNKQQHQKSANFENNVNGLNGLNGLRKPKYSFEILRHV